MEEGCKLSRITCKDSIISSTTSRRLLFLVLLQIPHTRFILSLVVLHRVSQLLPNLHFCIPSGKRLYSSSLAFFAASLPLLFILYDYNNCSAVKDFACLICLSVNLTLNRIGNTYLLGKWSDVFQRSKHVLLWTCSPMKSLIDILGMIIVGTVLIFEISDQSRSGSTRAVDLNLP